MTKTISIEKKIISLLKKEADLTTDEAIIILNNTVGEISNLKIKQNPTIKMKDLILSN